MLLVTGGTGFIGSQLLECAPKPLRVLVRRKNAELPAGVEAAFGDLVTGEGVAEALRGVDTVIHLAGVTKALRPADYYGGNARATETLARAAAGAPSGPVNRFVHVSSLAAVGPSLDGAPLAEEAAPHPPSHYGKSKLEAERIVRALLPQSVIVRPPVVYGPRDTGVFQILKSIAGGWFLDISGGDAQGARWFSAIYVEDLVEGLLAAAAHPAAQGRDYFMAHPQPVSWRGLAETAAGIMGVRVRRVAVPGAVAYAVGACADLGARATGRPGIVSRDKVTEARYACWTCDPRRAAAELGFRARTPLETGIARTLAWYKEAGWLKY